MNDKMVQIDNHIREVISYAELINSGQFKGADAATVVHLRGYFKSILLQLKKAKEDLAAAPEVVK